MTLYEWLNTQSYPADDVDLTSAARLYLKKGAGRSLKSGGQWIYDNEVAKVEYGAGPSASFANGSILQVFDFDGYPLGYGFINTLSKIRVRMLSRYGKDGITPAFLKARVRDAYNYRKAVTDISCCRLIFGEADFLPGLTVDKFSDVLVVESLALGTERYKILLLKELVDILAEDGITVRGIYERSDAKVRALEGLERTKGFIGPEFDTDVPIVENGVKYIVDVKDGQKTGFFLDQKNNRAAVADIVRRLSPQSGKPRSAASGSGPAQLFPAAATGPSVLDCFTHTGSFGLNCALAGAGSVLSVDASELAIRQAMENARLNGLSPRELTTEEAVGAYPAQASAFRGPAAPEPASGQTSAPAQASAPGVCYLTADIFDLLPKLEEAGKQYDIVILDPPAFTKSRQMTKNAIKGYREINLRGMKLVKDGGFLATCSCSHFMEEELFKKTLKEAAHGAHRRLRQIEYRTQAPDHPILWGDDESYYLKFLIFQVVSER